MIYRDHALFFIKRIKELYGDVYFCLVLNEKVNALECKS